MLFRVQCGIATKNLIWLLIRENDALQCQNWFFSILIFQFTFGSKYFAVINESVHAPCKDPQIASTYPNVPSPILSRHSKSANLTHSSSLDRSRFPILKLKKDADCANLMDSNFDPGYEIIEASPSQSPKTISAQFRNKTWSWPQQTPTLLQPRNRGKLRKFRSACS